jgi:hypothetical protein
MSSNVQLRLQIDLFLRVSLTDILYFHSCYMSKTSHPFTLSPQQNLYEFKLCNFFQSFVNGSILGPDFLPQHFLPKHPQSLSMLVFWVVTSCGLVGRYQHVGGTYCLHLLP